MCEATVFVDLSKSPHSRQRRAKSRCAIPQAGPPCVECQQMNRRCTFDELPPARKTTKPPQSSPVPSTSTHLATDSMTTGKRPRSPEDGSAALQALSYAAAQEKRLRIGDAESNFAHIQLPFDLSISRSLDPHAITTLLTDDLLPIGTRQQGPEDAPLSETPHIRQISSDRSKPQYLIFTKRRNESNLEYGKMQLGLLKTCMALLEPPPSEDSLIDIYLGFSNPAFPLVFIPPDEYQLDPLLLSKLYLTALTHYRHYRSSIVAIRNMMSTHVEDTTHTPLRLSTISSALLELSSRPVLDPQKNYIILARTIAQAQLLGLHINPTTWHIPSWEKDLRCCLWWALQIHDAWMSFLNSRPSHIQIDNHSTPLPDLTGLLSPTNPLHTADTVHSASSFVFLCRLAVLCSRLQCQVCTLTANTLAPAERLRRVKSIEEDTQLLLQEVRRDGHESRSSCSGVASLLTCLLGFRCMLRRISIELSIGLGSPFTPDPATLEIYADAVNYVCSDELDGRAFDGFWLNYVGHILSSLTSSLIRLSLATSTQASTALSPQRTSFTIQASSRTMPLLMLSRLQQKLQLAKRDYCWDLADAALSRAESVANCLKTSSEYTNVVAALAGTYEPAPIILPPLNGELVAQKSNGVQDPAPTSGGVDQYGWNIQVDLNAFGLEWSGADAGLWGPATAGDGHVMQPMYSE
ncbi:hypothetical protein FB45DRAFT_1151589 [Roridomyces roridus]|uniref:Xylanolytic transcriptional activator regulatory domain-containing protein n=1 Tax=Roridomyces roridus TaxID=1738132 RepID=A0AAD7BUB7_9AGAR|nr:hypothetical protein FB45DRAFT_1151589 [Roridomyces roridus]